MQSLKDFDPEPLLATMARIFAKEGKAREVAVLANAKGQVEYDGYESYYNVYGYHLMLEIPVYVFTQINDAKRECEEMLVEQARNILNPLIPEDEVLNTVAITPMLKADSGWQEKAKAWLAGEGVTNQGRVRSDNIASKTCDGLLFRSEPEINLYKAFKARGVSFAPLPVFIRGGKTYSRIEPDFVILKDGIVMVVEVDGDTVHQETPAEAHARTTMLAYEGAAVERVKASECATEDLANACAERLLAALAKLKSSR